MNALKTVVHNLIDLTRVVPGHTPNNGIAQRAA